MNHDRPKVSLEDLLRLKRAERPPAEFWTHFERELRAKQLAAIVERRPWWHAFPRAFAGMARLHVPLGATAVLALTILTVREYRVPSVDRDLAAPVAAPATRMKMPAPVASVPAPEVAAMATTTPEQPAAPSIAAREPAVSTVSPGGIALGFNGLGASSPAEDSRPPNLASRLIDENLMKLQAGEPEFVTAMADHRGFEARALPARSPVAEPLAQLATPTKVNLRNRYLGSALATGYSVETAGPSAGRMVNRIQAKQLRADEISRFDAQGNSFTLKL